MGFRADLIVEDNVIVEINSVEAIAPVHKNDTPILCETPIHLVGLMRSLVRAFRRAKCAG